MITAKKLTSAGYHQYPAGHKGQFCKGLWQKWVTNGTHKLFAINFYLWEFPGTMHTSGTKSVSVEVRLYTENDEFDLDLFVEDKTIADVEAFYHNAFTALNCVPNKHNN